MRWRGRPLKSEPMDIVVTRDGAVWFTDRRRRRARPRPVLPARVYRLDPAGDLTAMADGVARPHTLAFSPDETVLYVRDGRRRHVHAFDVRRGFLSNHRLLDPPRQAVTSAMFRAIAAIVMSCARTGLSSISSTGSSVWTKWPGRRW